MLPAQLGVSGPGNAGSGCVPTDPLTNGRIDHPKAEIVRNQFRHTEEVSVWRKILTARRLNATSAA
jgi:hypothetical protein